MRRRAGRVRRRRGRTNAVRSVYSYRGIDIGNERSDSKGVADKPKVCHGVEWGAHRRGMVNRVTLSQKRTRAGYFRDVEGCSPRRRAFRAYSMRISGP